MFTTLSFSFNGISERKYIWKYFDVQKSLLYIKQWRVPLPVPKNIYVTFITDKDYYIPDKILKEPYFKKNPSKTLEELSQFLNFNEDFSSVVKYSKRNVDSTFIPTVYVPKFIFEDQMYPESIQVVVKWVI